MNPGRSRSVTRRPAKTGWRGILGMDFRRCRQKSALGALSLFFVLGAAASMSAEKLELPEGFSLWQRSAHLRVGAGYKDNVTLSHFDPPSSAFEMASADVMLFRLPWNGWDFSLMGVASDVRYFRESIGVDAEQNAAVSSQLGWFMSEGWKSTTALQYVFINQVMDVSAVYGAAVREQVHGHGITLTEGVRRDAAPWWAELSLLGSLYYFRQPLDDYWQAGPRISLGCYYGHGSEIGLSYQAFPQAYDSREQTDPTGAPVPGTRLRYWSQQAELSWQHNWDEQRRWRSITRCGFEHNQDNGSGYYDYLQYRIAEQLRYRAAGWDFSVQGALAYYDFPRQALSLTDPRLRHRTSIHLTVRGEKSLSKHWRICAAYDYERSLSNQQAEQYRANTASAGVDFEF